jgi:hypothetical protein
MYLAGSFLMFLAFLTVIGVLISDHGARGARSAHPAAGRKARNERHDAVPRRASRSALCLDGSLRSLDDRDDDASRRSVFLASQWKTDVVEVQAPQAGADLRHHPRHSLCDDRIAEFLAPYNLATRNVSAIYAPPQSVHLFHEGSFVGPFVYGRMRPAQHGESEARICPDDTKNVQKLRFFCSGRQI